ncbi:helix-turn-helix domain-containing protein [Streptomyces sp. NPDC035033]|uniref:helix-turn-helix domain-containing protein n=1 Tax=Streptomyces sp. NPDC035033 TaxID=3155368 RepID=UPI0033E6D4CE
MHSAAAEFASRGYDGTSFARVCREAAVTMGALTFHFPTKASLARAVGAAGIEATHSAVDDADARAATPLASVGGIAQALAELLNGQALVRAAARLAREHPALEVDWRSSWLPLVRTRLYQAHVLDQLRPGTQPETAALLVGSLVAGLEVGLLPHSAGRPRTAQQQLAEQWQTALVGIGLEHEHPARAS